MNVYVFKDKHWSVEPWTWWRSPAVKPYGGDGDCVLQFSSTQENDRQNELTVKKYVQNQSRASRNHMRWDLHVFRKYPGSGKAKVIFESKENEHAPKNDRRKKLDRKVQLEFHAKASASSKSEAVHDEIKFESVQGRFDPIRVHLIRAKKVLVAVQYRVSDRLKPRLQFQCERKRSSTNNKAEHIESELHKELEAKVGTRFKLSFKSAIGFVGDADSNRLSVSAKSAKFGITADRSSAVKSVFLLEDVQSSCGVDWRDKEINSEFEFLAPSVGVRVSSRKVFGLSHGNLTNENLRVSQVHSNSSLELISRFHNETEVKGLKFTKTGEKIDTSVAIKGDPGELFSASVLYKTQASGSLSARLNVNEFNKISIGAEYRDDETKTISVYLALSEMQNSQIHFGARWNY